MMLTPKHAAERMGVSVRTARRAARDLDRRRTQFERTMYRVYPNDPHQYDVVIDSNSLGIGIAAELIVRVVEAGKPKLVPRLSNDEPPQLYA